jgi:subtilisin family serine protease
MNISFSTYPSVDLNRAVSEAVDDGIVVVVSAGNARDDACRYSPAAAPAAVTVGATEPSDARLAQSNFGPCVDIFAPGHFIFSAWNTGPSDARSLKGTSFAAPHVTGAAALLLEADPSLSPAQVAAALLSSATRGALTDVGTGSPNALLWVDPAPLPAPPTTTTVPPTTTTTVPPTVRISQAGRGYWRVEVTGAPPSATIGVRATNASRRPPEVVTWLVDTDSDGSAVFFVRKNLSRHTGQVVSH